MFKIKEETCARLEVARVSGTTLKRFSLQKENAWNQGGLCVKRWGQTMFACYVDGNIDMVEEEARVVAIEVLVCNEEWGKRNVPHESNLLAIQNACGTWNFGNPHDLRCTVTPLLAKRKRRAWAKRETVYASACTFVLSGVNLYKVDFRGMRAYTRMLEDWLLLLGNRNEQYLQKEEITCSVYMVLLKGNVGYCLAMRDCTNYVAVKMAGSSKDVRIRCAEDQICDVVEFIDINWNFSLWKDTHAVVREGVSKVEISRLGGVVMRIMFAKGVEWDATRELEVLESCNLVRKGFMWVLGGHAIP